MLWLALTTLTLASSGITSGKSSDFYVKSLPDYNGDDFPIMHAGKIDVGTPMGAGERSLFFWHVQAEVNTQKTILWLNGGPGCSSMDGGLLEIGPFRFEDKKITRSSDSWSSFANLLFVDQPFGTGFSDPIDTDESGQFVHSLEDAAKAVVQFLSEYAKIFPEIQNTKIYLAGESFAGQYIPHIWKYLQQRPDIIEQIDPHRNGVNGAILIAPWIDPAHQYLSQATYAKQYGLIDMKNFDFLDILQSQCIESLQNGGSQNFENEECEKMNQYIMSYSAGGPDVAKCFNIYDVSKISPFPSCGAEWPEELPDVSEYLSRDDVQEALHASSTKGPTNWNECSRKVHTAMQKGQVSSEFLGEMIKNVPLMVVAGENDWICNHIGLEQFIKNLNWKEATGFVETAPIVTDYGSTQSERGLTFVRVANGSHMIPVDHLSVSGRIAREFLNISDSNTTLESKPSTPDTQNIPTNDEAINQATYRAYRKAGGVALVVVLVIMVVLIILWWKTGHKLSGQGLANALLQVGRARSHSHGERFEDRVPLRQMGRRPSVIPEEDEDFEV